MENQIIYHFQKSYQGNKQEMAEKLGLSRTTLWKKIKKLDIL
jgi:transcriptional regulator of acetoin/glycerol metabolism